MSQIYVPHCRGRTATHLGGELGGVVALKVKNRTLERGGKTGDEEEAVSKE